MNKNIQGNVRVDQIDDQESRVREQTIKTPADTPVQFSPIRFLAITVGGIFLAEVIAMIIVYGFQDLPYSIRTLIDASVMVLMIFPLIYFFSLKPLLVHIEKHRQMEESLRQSEVRFAKAFHSSPAALTITRVEDGQFIDVNESFMQLSGYAREELLGQTSIDLGMFIHPEVRADLKEQTIKQHLLGKQGVRDYEVDTRVKSGEVHTVLISTEGIELDGKPCILSSISDITERKQTEEIVKTERQRFYDVLETLPAYLVLLTPDYHVPFANRFFRERFGESGGRRCYEYLFGRSEACEICETYKVLNTNTSGKWEWTGPDGRIYDVFDYPFTDVDGSPLILEMGIDITDQKLAEARLRRANRALSVLNECNQVLVHAEDESEFLQQMCEIIVKIGGYRMAWVGLAEQDQAKSVRPAAQFGFEDGYLDSIQITWADNERGRGPTGTAIRQGVVQVNQNFLTNPSMMPWRETALLRGYQSSIALPLQDETSTFGALTIYSATPDAFDEDELHLLKELANDLAFGITALRIRAERMRTEDANRQLSRIVEQTEDTVVVTNREGVIEYVNPAFERLTGYTKEEALGKTPRVIKSDVHDREFYQNLWNAILRGDVFQSEIANRRKNGELFYEVKTITPLRDAQGNITHFVATGKDITDHKRDEEKLRRAYDDLELRVQDRTEELRIANSELEDEINIRRRTEEALLQSERRLSRAQEIAHLGSWELDLENDRLNWSDEVYRIFGLRPQEFKATYEAFLKAVHPDDRAAVDNAYSGSIRDGKNTYEIEHRIVKRPSGEIRIVHEKCEHFRDQEGRIIRSVGMVHDITERKRAEQALRESEEKFRSAFADAAIGFAMTTPNGRFVDANPAYCKLTGYNIDELQRLEFPDLIHPDDHAENIKLIDRMLAGEIADFVVENRYLRKDGKSVWVRKSVSLVRNIENAPQWIIALVEDITKRKQAEEALRAARDELELRVQERTQELAIANMELVKEIAERKEIERQLRIQTTAMEAAANGIIITDHQGNIQWTNPALTQISGYAAYDLIGKSTHVFKSGKHDEVYYRHMWDTILSGQVWRGETTNRRKDGTLYIEEQTITPVRDENGQIPHFIAIKQDITQRKQAEEEMEQRNRELQAMSNAEREQRQLAEALVQAALVLNKSLKLDEVLTHILEQIKEVIPYQVADITLLERETFYDASHQGDWPWLEILASTQNRFVLNDFPLIKEMVRTNQPILIRDTQKEPNWISVHSLDRSRSFLSAPLLVEQKVIGFVNLFADQPDFFTPQMCEQLVAFAAHAVAAIQNAWLFEQVRASSERLQSLSRRLVEIQESERLYISRELHDEAGQILTSLMLDLRLLEKEASQPEVVVKQAAKMEASLNEVLENLHRVAMALRPASLDHLGLVAALRQLVESMGEKHGLKVSFRAGKVRDRLPANVETVLYRIVQEALTNIVRHAQASRVDVVLTVRDHQLVVIIEDDGIGFDPETASSGEHLGLFGMRERAEMIDGTLTIESAPGKGTTIMLEVGYANTNLDRG